MAIHGLWAWGLRISFGATWAKIINVFQQNSTWWVMTLNPQEDSYSRSIHKTLGRKLNITGHLYLGIWISKSQRITVLRILLCTWNHSSHLVLVLEFKRLKSQRCYLIVGYSRVTAHFQNWSVQKGICFSWNDFCSTSNCRPWVVLCFPAPCQLVGVLCRLKDCGYWISSGRPNTRFLQNGLASSHACTQNATGSWLKCAAL